jgi:hypothetical protein
MDVDGGEDHSECIFGLAGGGVEGEQESDGVGTARDGGAEAVAGAEVFAGKGKSEWGGRHRFDLTLALQATSPQELIRRSCEEDA